AGELLAERLGAAAVVLLVDEPVALLERGLERVEADAPRGEPGQPIARALLVGEPVHRPRELRHGLGDAGERGADGVELAGLELGGVRQADAVARGAELLELVRAAVGSQ